MEEQRGIEGEAGTASSFRAWLIDRGPLLFSMALLVLSVVVVIVISLMR